MILRGSKNGVAKLKKEAAKSAIKNITIFAAYRHLAGEICEV